MERPQAPLEPELDELHDIQVEIGERATEPPQNLDPLTHRSVDLATEILDRASENRRRAQQPSSGETE